MFQGRLLLSLADACHSSQDSIPQSKLQQDLKTGMHEEVAGFPAWILPLNR